MTSKIKVDNIENQCGGAVVTKCGGTTTISGTVVKSNTLQASDAGNIISQSGTTITLGASGDTINLASGASQSGFGRTGTVDWQTGSIKTSTFTAANGEGYFANTAGGTFTMNLPAGVVGAIVSVQDYNNTFDSNALTVDANGSEKINGGDGGEPVELSTEGRGVTFVYVDATVGWRSVQDNDFTKKGVGATFIVATGGTITTVCTNYKAHTFTGPGTFTVCSVGCAAGSNEISYMVVAAGGGGAEGGGGAGGFREGKTPQCTYTASPIACTSGSNNGLPVTATGYPVVIGGGGSPNGDGASSTFAGTTTIASTGGGGGGGFPQPGNPGGSGGGGGGGPNPGSGSNPGGTGNTPPVSPSQGFPGGSGQHTCGAYYGSGGGGGSSEVGASKSGPQTQLPFGNGGDGVTTSINGSSTAYGGGGGSNVAYCTGGTGGAGGGGAGAGNVAGTINSGGGGGGSGSGGSGVVIIRYKFQ